MAKDFLCSKTAPIVQTQEGRLRGFRYDGTYIFQGVDYAWADRFEQPQPVKPWEGVKDALSYGYVCPLLDQEVPQGEIMIPHRYWPMDEHCQNLNIWTPTLDPAAKKPVMVWLHGGGFSSGSAIEHVAYDGENMSKFGDVVVVSINHRLNILGYLDLSPFGDKYRNSANAGNADMVEALRWIRRNIESFGGDPENVTLFGQSGGGMKVWTLMQTPEADGLFQKGIIQSGLVDGFMEDAHPDTTQIIDAMLDQLGLDRDQVDQLASMPYAQLAQAYKQVAPKLDEQGVYTGCNPLPNDFYLGDPRQIGFTDHAKTIPVMIGTVLGEFAFGPGVADKYSLPDKAMREMIAQKYGAAAEELIRLFQATYPEKNLTDLLFLDSVFRAPTRDFIAKKSQHAEAPTYSYLFTYEFPYDDGHIAWHCAEIPFCFHNMDKVPVYNTPGVTDQLQEQIFGAWINFGRYGDPNYVGLPQWPACAPGDEATMIFDTHCQVRHNHDGALIDLHVKSTPAFFARKDDEDEMLLH